MAHGNAVQTTSTTTTTAHTRVKVTTSVGSPSGIQTTMDPTTSVAMDTWITNVRNSLTGVGHAVIRKTWKCPKFTTTVMKKVVCMNVGIMTGSILMETQ